MTIGTFKTTYVALIIFLLASTGLEDCDNFEYPRQLRTGCGKSSSLIWVWSSSATHWLSDPSHASSPLWASSSWEVRLYKWPVRSDPVVSSYGCVEQHCHFSGHLKEGSKFPWLALVVGPSWPESSRVTGTPGVSDRLWVALCLLFLVILGDSSPRSGPMNSDLSTLVSHSILPGQTAPGERHTCPVL